MGQAHTPPAPFLFLEGFIRTSFILSFLMVCGTAVPAGLAQATKTQAVAVTPQHALEIAEQGRCKEAIPALKKVLAGNSDAETKKRIGLMGIRCAMTTDDRSAAAEFLQAVWQAFPNDPEVLYVAVHAYSDLSTRAAQDLGRAAPQSVPALKLSAESLEVQGKWEEAAKIYDVILNKAPNTQGIHFRVGRLLLSRPDADANAADKAKLEFESELRIDPQNAVAAFILGQLAQQKGEWEEAEKRFSQAAGIDSNFGDAFLGWGISLVNLKRFNDAISPLQRASKMQPLNPAAHYNLGLALARSGRKEEADKEFAIQREITAKRDAEKNAAAPNQPQQ